MPLGFQVPTSNQTVKQKWRFDFAISPPASVTSSAHTLPNPPSHSLFLCAGYVPASATLRLANQDDAGCGRVEVLHEGQWGTVCDDFWDNADGTVACRQLGLSFIAYSIKATYGQGDGAIWMDNLMCNGLETNLESCVRDGWGVHNCNHGEDAGVCCFGESTRCQDRNHGVNA